jgi:hypothetical protein
VEALTPQRKSCMHAACRPKRRVSEKASLPFQAVASVAHSPACHPGQCASKKRSRHSTHSPARSWAARERRIEPAISGGHFSCAFACLPTWAAYERKVKLPFLTRLLAPWAARERRIEPAIAISSGHFSCAFACLPTWAAYERKVELPFCPLGSTRATT